MTNLEKWLENSRKILDDISVGEQSDIPTYLIHLAEALQADLEELEKRHLKALIPIVVDGWKRGRITWNKGNKAVYHHICIGCGLRHEMPKKRQQFCSRRCAAIVRGRRGHNDRSRDEATGRFLQATA